MGSIFLPGFAPATDHERLPDRRPPSVRRSDDALQYEWGWGLQQDMFGSEHKHVAASLGEPVKWMRCPECLLRSVDLSVTECPHCQEDVKTHLLDDKAPVHVARNPGRKRNSPVSYSFVGQSVPVVLCKERTDGQPLTKDDCARIARSGAGTFGSTYRSRVFATERKAFDAATAAGIAVRAKAPDVAPSVAPPDRCWCGAERRPAHGGPQCTRNVHHRAP